MNSGDLVDAMAFHPVTLEALFIACVYRNKFIHQLEHLSQASFSSGTVPFFSQRSIWSEQTLKGGRAWLTFKILPGSFMTALRNLLYSHD